MQDRPPPGRLPRGPIVVRCVERLDALAPHREAWDELALAAPQGLPMLSHAWVSAFLLHRVAAPATWRVLLAFRGDELVGVLPLVRTPHEQLGGNRPRLRLPRDLHTRSGDAVLAAGVEHEALSAMIAEARRLEPRLFSIDFSGVREGSPTIAALAAGTAKVTALDAPDERGSYVAVAGTMDEFRATLGDNFRRNLKKAGNRFEREPGAGVRLLSGPSAHPALLDDFLALEAAGWKGAEGTAIAADPSLVAFYRTLVSNLAAKGWLEWHFLDIGGKPAAAHLAVRFGRALVLLKIAYDESHSRLGPGNLLFERVLLHAFEGKEVDEVNCTTDMPWHRNWEMPQSAYHDLSVFPRSPLSILMGVVHARLKAAAKKIPGLVPLVRATRKRKESP